MGDITKMDAVLKTNVHEFHMFLAHSFDQQKMEANLRKKGNVTQL